MKHMSRKGIAALVFGVVLMVAAIMPAFSQDVQVVAGTVTPAIEQFYADYGVSAATLEKKSADLTAAERKALASIYHSDGARGALNALLYKESLPVFEDGNIVVKYTLAGHVLMFGTADAFDSL